MLNILVEAENYKKRVTKEMEIVTGYVEHIVFRNNENGYTVFNLERNRWRSDMRWYF